jgi:polysaccharide biosynthesis protein PslG
MSRPTSLVSVDQNAAGPVGTTGARAVSRRRRPPLPPVALLVGLAAIVAAIIGLVRQSADQGPPEATPLPRTVCAGPQIGVHSNLGFTLDSERREETVSAIDEYLHAQVVRESLLWHQIEPVEGEFDWSRIDSSIEELRAAGIEPLLTVYGSPAWANGIPESTARHYLYVPARGPALDAWLQDYSEFLAVVVERYHEFVRRWEIWNEPNLMEFWHPRPDPVAYRQVYETLRKTILSVDPNAEVAVGGLGSLTVPPAPPGIPGVDFLRLLVDQGPPIDHVAIHPYTTDNHSPGVHIPGEKNFDDIGLVKDQLAAQGLHPAIWITEWGWSSAEIGDELQAQYVNRSLAMLEHRFSFVRVATYFLDHDLPPDFFQGLLEEDLEPKPAASAFRTHADLAASRCEQRDR